MRSRFRSFSSGFAEALLKQAFHSEWIVEVCVEVLGPFPHFAKRLARRLQNAFPSAARPPQKLVERFLQNDAALFRFFRRFRMRIPVPLGKIARMAPGSGNPSSWRVPGLVTEGDLALWMGMEPSRLVWFADQRGTEARVADGPLRHYHRYWVAKRHGHARLIEVPKSNLKAIQRKILAEILAYIPPHDAAHGFRAGRSVLTFAQPHCGKAMLLRMDLQEFFPSITEARVAAIFRMAGYPERVARILAGLACTVTPVDIYAGMPASASQPNWNQRKRMSLPHLPQGAPTSPALANLVAFRLDLRLSGLAKSAGVDYTRYADDLTFSGGRDFARMAGRFENAVAVIALEEGFEVNHRKTRSMSQSVSQRTAGVVVNQHVGIPRKDFDRLKAILHNCAVHGPTAENRERHPDFQSHLAGRVAQVRGLDPRRGERLACLFGRIEW